MSFELWLLFVVASSALLIMPGPTTMLVVSYAIGYGKSSKWAIVPAVVLGHFTAITVSLLGAGAVLAASATVFTILKLFGALYLIWLGVKLWRTKPKLGELEYSKNKKSSISIFRNAYIVTALNPKSILFFIAFVPQFIDSNMASLPQFIILEVTFIVLAAINILTWSILASKLRDKLKSVKTLQIINRFGASFLIGAGLITAGTGNID